VAAKPLWSSHFLALHFIVSALMVGAALHIVFVSTTYLFKTGSIPEKFRELFSRDYRPMLIGLIIVNFVLMGVKYIPGMFSPEQSLYVRILLAGPYSLPLWAVEVWFGGILPLIILLYPRTKGSMPWLMGAALLIAVGVYFSKYDLIIAGQSIGPTFTEAFIPYFPDVWEFLLLVGGVAVCLLFYTLGERLLPLELEEKPAWFVFMKRAPLLERGTIG